jgi:hypothetical protein
LVVTFVTGRMGSGKTLFTIIRAWLAYYSRHVILGNLTLTLKNSYYVEPRDLILALADDKENAYTGVLTNGNIQKTLIIDEVQNVADSRTSGSITNRYLSSFLTQTRKMNIDVLYISQIDNGAERRFRINTDYIVSCFCKKKHGEKHPYRFDYYTCMVDRPKKVRHWKLPFPVAEWYFKFYKTEERIKPIEMQDIELKYGDR